MSKMKVVVKELPEYNTEILDNPMEFLESVATLMNPLILVIMNNHLSRDGKFRTVKKWKDGWLPITLQAGPKYFGKSAR